MPASNDIKIYDDIDAHIESIVDQEKDLKQQANRDKHFSQRELNRLSRDKAVHLRLKKQEFHNDPDPRASFLEWCNDVAGLKGETNPDRYVRAAEVLQPHKFLGVVDIGIKALCAIGSKSLNQTEMTALQQYCITEDKTLSEHRIHVWAHETCDRPLPEKSKKHVDGIIIDARSHSMDGRIELALSGYTLLGLTRATPIDVQLLVCKHWQHKYHPDKGGDVATYQKIQAAVEVVKNDK